MKASPTECTLCHVPYDESGVPFPTQLSSCALCRQGKVPSVLFATIEPPDSLPLQGKGCLIQARVCRSKKEWRGELNAKDISDTLPFLEYELHHQLLNKLRLNGMNALFGFQSRVHVGYNILVAIATATAVNVPSLPPAAVPSLVCKTTSSADEEAKLAKLQAKIRDVAKRNAAIHGVDGDRKKFLYGEFESCRELSKSQPGLSVITIFSPVRDLDLDAFCFTRLCPSCFLTFRIILCQQVRIIHNISRSASIPCRT